MASIKDKWSKVHTKATGSGAWNGGTAASEDEEIRSRWQNNNNTASYSGTTVMQGDLARAAAVSRLQNQQRAQASTGAADQNSPAFDMGLRAGAVERAVRGETVQLPGTVRDLGELPAFSKLEDTKNGSNEDKYSAVNRYFAENPTAQKLWNLERGYNPNQNATAARKQEAEAIRARMSDDELRAYNDATALYDSYGKGYSVGKRTKDMLEGSFKGALDSMAVFMEGMPAASSEENKQAQWEMRQAMDNGTVFTQDDDGNLKVSDDYKKALDTFEQTKDDSPVRTEDFAPALKRNRERAAQVQRGGEGLTGAAAKTYELGASMAGNAGSMALGLVPGIGQALSLGTLGLQAAGSRADELSARDIPTREALARGAVSGGIEVGTEMVPIGEWVPEQVGKWIKRPVKNWIKIVKEGGESVAENIAKQALGEATEEGTSYVLNYLADLAYKDPEAEFSLAELADNMVMGAASGGVYGAVGTGINRALGGSANVQDDPAYRNAPDGVVNEGTVRAAQQETAAPVADTQAAAPVNVAQQAADQAFVQDLLQQVQDATAPKGQQIAQNVDEQNLLQEIAAQRQMVDSGMTADEAETTYREQAQQLARQAQEEARQRMAEQEAARQAVQEAPQAAVQQSSAENTAQSRVQEVQRIAAETPSYNDAMRQAFADNYQGGSVDAYTQAMDGMYNAGRTGALTYEQAVDAVGAAGAVVNNQQALQAAYQAGAEGVTAPVDPAGAGAVQGSVSYENGLTLENSHMPAEVLGLTAQKLGVDIKVVQNLTDGDGNTVNGHWAAGLSQIALGENSSNSYQTLMHELTHYMGSYNAEGLARTRNAVLDFYARNAGMTAAQEHVFEQYENAYGNSAVGADEAARDILSGIMSTEDGVQQFCDYLNDAGMYSTAEKKTILQTVRDMIAKIVEKLRAMIHGGDATQGAAEGRKLAERADAMGEAASIIDDFIAELDVARQNAQEKGQGENVQVEQKNAPTEMQSAKKSSLATDVGERALGEAVASKRASAESTTDTVEVGSRPSDSNIQQEGENVNTRYSLDTLSEETKINDDAAGHTKAEQQRIEEYKNAVDPDLMEFIQNAREHPNARWMNYTLGEVSSETASQVKALTGVDVTGYTHNIQPDTIQHIDKRHGMNGQADHSMALDADISRIGWVLDNYDSIELGEGSSKYQNKDRSFAKTVVYKKAIDGTMYVVEAVPDSKAHKMQVATAYIENRKTGAYHQPDTMNRPKATAKTDGELTPAKNSIAQTENNVKKRFSLDVPVEETKDLVAVHNVDEDSLDRSLDLGSMPMPSIAVVKSEQGHTKYGPISLVFGKDSIDPQANSKNRVYGGDGWTPTKPRVDYEVNYDATRKFEKGMSELSKQVAGGTFDAQSILRKRGVDDTTSKNINELAKELASDDSIRAAYLADNGKTLEPVLKDRVWDKYGNDSLQQFTDKVGVQRLAEINAELDAGTSVNEALGADADTVRGIIRDYYAKSQEPIVQRAAARNSWTAEQTDAKRQERLNRTMENRVTPFTVEDFVKHAWDMYTDGGSTKGEIDRYETSAKLRNAVDDTQVAKWVRGKLEGVLGKSGVYNGKDPYMPNGNSRSFDQLHYPETLENLVRVMSETQEERGEGVWGLTANGLQSVSTPSYDSIAAMKKDSSRLGSAESESYKAQMQAVDDQIGAVIGKIQQETKAHSDNPFEEADIIGSVIMEAAGKKSAAAIRNVFAKEGYSISTDTAKQLLMLYSDAAELPTEYFEAKPRRAVGFNEVKAAIVPDNTSPAVREKLEKAGVPVVEYAAGDEAARLKALNDLNDVRFSKNSSAQADSEATLQDKLTETQRQNKELARKVTKAQEQADYWRQETQLTGGHQVDPKALRQAATDFLSRYESNYDRATFTEELQRAFVTIKKDGSNTSEALETLTSLARSALRESTHVDTTARDYYAPVREWLRSTPILVQEGSPEYADLLAAFGDGDNGKRNWGNVRKNTFGRLDLKLVPNGQSGNVDTVVQEMSGNWPNIFDESAAPSDNVQRALDVFGASAIEYHDVYGSDLDQAAAHAGQELMDTYLTMPAKQTRADKQLAKLQETRRTLQAEKKAALATQKQAYEARVKELEAGQSARKAQLRTKYLEATRKAAVANNTDTAARLTKQAEGYKAQLAELNSYNNKALNKKLIDQQARYEILNQRRNDTILQTRARDSVQKSVQQLYRWLSKPNDAGHVQTRMESAVYDLLTQIDPNTSSDNTKTAVRWQETMKDIRSMAQEALAADRGEADVADYADFDPDLPNSIKELLDDAGSMSLRDMNGRQTQMLADILTSMKTSIQNANKMLSDGRAAKVEEVATKSIREMEGVKASQLKTRNELVGKMADSRTYDMVSQLLGLDMMDARRFFSSLGGTVEQEVYKPIRDGFDKRVWKLEAAQEQFAKIKGDTDISKWTGSKANKQTFTLGSGQTVELTVGQMMELYNLSQRPQAKDHLMQGGISMMQDGKRSGRLKIDATDLANITGALTNEQVRMARAMAGYLSAADGPAGWGNEVTQQLYGLDKFSEGYYWPIKTDSNYTRTSDANATDTAGLYAIKNQGFTKALQRKANNPLLINDAFDTWCDHVANMATYNAWAIPLSDAMKWYNYKVQDANITLSTKEALEGVYGAKGKKYFQTLMQDINGVSAGAAQTGYARLTKSMIRNWKVAKVGANLRVAIQQPTAYMRAAAVIDPKYLAGALAYDVGRLQQGMDRAESNCGIAKWKSWGYFETNIGQTMKSVLTGETDTLDKVREVSTSLAELGDRVTWGTLWNACELEAKDKGMKAGSQESIDYCARRLSEIVDKTQVVDSVLHRSQIMRSKDMLAQMATNFFAEPTKTYSMMAEAAVKMAHKDKGAKAYMGRVTATYLATAFATSAASSLIDAWRVSDDDKDKEFGERYLNALWDGFVDNINMINNIPFFKDIKSIFDGYDATRTDMEAATDLYNALSAWQKLLSGNGGKTTPYKLLYKTANAFADISGIPTGTAVREVKSAYDLVTGMQDPLHIDEAIANSNAKMNSRIARGNMDEAQDLLDDLAQKKVDSGKTEKEAKSTMRSSLTGYWKPLYVAADDAGRAEIAAKLLGLKCFGEVIYSQKDLDKWVKDSSK